MRHDGGTSPWSTKKASMSEGGREADVHGKYGEAERREWTIRRWGAARGETWSNDRRRRGGYGHRGGGGEDARMVVLCKGRSLINHGGPWVESVARVSRPEGREWSKEKRGGREGIGTINIVFATILGTSAERPALWASSRVGGGGRGWR